MQTHSQVLAVIVFICLALMLAIGGLLVNQILSRPKPSAAKSQPYESGEAPAAGGWGQFDMRYYQVGLLFLLFEVELVFLFPLAAVVKNGPDNIPAQDWKLWMQTEGIVFILLLAIGLAYAWRMGLLDWYRIKRNQSPISQADATVPKPDYEAVNQKVKTVLPQKR